MTTSPLILGLTGSLRAHSTNKGILRAVQELLPAAVQMEIFPVEELPFYDLDLEVREPESVRHFKELLRRADAIVIATPEFNGSIPGVLKNALDWASRPYGESPLAEKPIAICGAAVGGGGTKHAQRHLREILTRIHPDRQPFVLVEPRVCIANSGEKFDTHGTLYDQETRQQLHNLLDTLLKHVPQAMSAALS